MCRSSDVPRSFEPNSRQARHAVLCEAREEPFERQVPTLFLQDCVSLNPQDVVDTADSQTLSLSAGDGKAGRVRAWLG